MDGYTGRHRHTDTFDHQVVDHWEAVRVEEVRLGVKHGSRPRDCVERGVECV